jgi:large subunit ribosomal protein L23
LAEKQDKSTVKKTEKVLDEKKTNETKIAKSKASSKTGKFSYSVVREPHISEKATYLADEGKYVFKVYGNTNKPEIKKSVEGIYGVNVLQVNIVKTPKKKRRLGRHEGFKKGYTKAIVTVKEGQKIEIL